jgi:hypothetical protein
MAKSNVYGAYEVREGFGPYEVGPLDLRTECRTEADARIEEMWATGRCVQLFGITNQESAHDEVRVLLRSLVALKAA